MHMLTSIRSKNQFWREHRHRIVENIRLTYEDF